MKGELVKDIRIIKNQLSYFGIMVLIAFLLSLNEGMTVFALSYASFMGMVFGVTTLNYDEYNNGLSYLMTLPVERKQYVMAKYIFSLISSLMFAGAVAIFCILYRYIMGKPLGELLSAAVSILPLAFILISVLLPIYIKFGATKARLVTGIAVGVSGGTYMGLMPLIFIGGDMVGPFNESLLYIVITAASVMALIISYRISVRIMEKKEF